MIVLIILPISRKHNSFNKVFVVIEFCLYLCRRFPQFISVPEQTITSESENTDQ